jgi:hypothetical protein
MALELRDRLAARLGVALPTTLAFDHPSVAQIAAFVETLLPAVPDDEAATRRRPDELGAAAQRADLIECMSNEELVNLVRTL